MKSKQSIFSTIKNKTKAFGFTKTLAHKTEVQIINKIITNYFSFSFFTRLSTMSVSNSSY